ncbi:MAG: alpha/beta hydrolase [Gemmatimonadetes bacterium]|nr:alpha/beta hydrolase [Gemmatimonadota bacterium]
MSTSMTRRQLIQGLAAMAPAAAAVTIRPTGGSLMAADIGASTARSPATRTQEFGPLSADVLPDGVRSRFVDNINGLRVHVLEAGYEGGRRPGLLLLHGFPELAYSWRNVMVPLAEAGYHVIAPDLRGYGRTTGWDDDYDGDLASFRRLNVVRDALGLVSAFGYRSLPVIGHDFGSPVAAWCAVVRPDVFTSVALMSAPFGGTSSLPFDTADNPLPQRPPGYNLTAELANLPRPRKHYQRYYTTREANENMWHPPQGLQAFIRGYYHYKSADWTDNKPFRLASRTAAEMAQMPTYYIMDLADGMAETVAKNMPTAAQIAANTWLPDNELQVYVEEYGRTGFQGGLNHYRSGGLGAQEQQLFAGRTIDQPSLFIAGASDWGSYQSPGALERMQNEACTDMRAVHMVEGAGHWVQQEQPEETSRLLIEFLRSL